MMILLNMAAGFATSLAPVLVSGVLLGSGFVVAAVRRRWKLLPLLLAVCIPCFLYLVVLLRMMSPGLVPFLKGGRLP